MAKGWRELAGTGSGRRREYTLTATEGHFSGSPLVNEIHLVSITDDSALAYSVDVGLIDYLFFTFFLPRNTASALPMCQWR